MSSTLLSARLCSKMKQVCGRSLVLAKSRNNIYTRTLLSEAFRCDNVWKSRLQEPLMQKIKPIDFYYELDRKFQAEKMISPIDVDMLSHAITDGAHLEELEDIIHRFRRTPATKDTLPSTHHAIIRAFLDHGKTDSLLRVLSDRVNYGIFPDNYSICLIMDTLIQQKNYSDAAKTAVLLMIQEDFGAPLCRLIAMYACAAHLKEPNPEPWFVEVQQEPVDEEDEEWVRVPEIWDPYFDDHFDLKKTNDLIGKTLAYAGKETTGVLGTTSEILGWSLYNKWDRLDSALETALKNKSPVLEEIVTRCLSCVDALPEVKEDTTKQTLLDKIKPKFDKLTSLGLVRPGSYLELLSAELKSEVERSEQHLITEHLANLERWSLERDNALQAQVDDYVRRERIRRVREKKEYLAKRERQLRFFDEFDKLDIEMTELEASRPEYERRLGLDVQKEQDYVPPEVAGSHQRSLDLKKKATMEAASANAAKSAGR